MPRKIPDISGQKFGRLTAVSLLPRHNWRGRDATWLCKCDCGKEFNARGSALRSGNTKSCGCLVREVSRESIKKALKKSIETSRLNLVGETYGRLTVLEDAPKRDNVSGIEYICQCKCGNICIVRSELLRNGSTKSCGCLKTEIAIKNIERINSLGIYKKKPKDLSGQKFGLLTPIELVDGRKNGRVIWRCLCDCGRECEADAYGLQSGCTTSCGCANNHRHNRKKLFYEITGTQSPNSDKVIFLDGNSANLVAENMMSISSVAYNQMRRHNLFTPYRELTKTAALACELLHVVREAEKEL